MLHRVTLLPADVKALAKPVNGSGGRQSLLRKLQRGTRRLPGGRYVLDIADEDVDRCLHIWQRTGGKPGAGGDQGRLPMDSLAAAGLVPKRQYRPVRAQPQRLFE